ncbi:hypothetical protein SAMN05892883_0822 [Jatrophihabitans sp. GAS493]|uniref:DUF6801 domain-containing protein n=1 Tax=Jatrophihabitans sp. GAS493 TaxID=1907575 RepID=UPI000BB98C8E|nr:DUF6801 domain-containing protein [Jatrophihabitans sp. GAS493]SOD71278.1 hypothetical protein SAMN05892883_0822 [Jatrophihabitans sp. GAS493]
MNFKKKISVTKPVGIAAVIGGVALSVVGVVAGATGASALSTINATVLTNCTIPVAGLEQYSAHVKADIPSTAKVGDQVTLQNFSISITLNVATTDALQILGATTLEGSITAGASLTNASPSNLQITATVPKTPVPQTQNAQGDGPEFTITATGPSPTATLTAQGTATLTATTVNAVFNPKNAAGTSVLPVAKQTIPCSYDPKANLVLGSIPVTAAGPVVTATPVPTATPAPTATPIPTATPAPTATPEPGSTPTPEPAATATPVPTATPAPTATPEPVATATPAPEATATPEPEATATPEPTETPLPPLVFAVDASGSPIANGTTLTPGQNVLIGLSGVAPDTAMDIVLHSTPQDLGTTTSDEDGDVVYPFTVPTGLEAGAHKLIFTGGGTSAEFDFVVAADASGVDPLVVTPVPTNTDTNLASTGYDSRPVVFGGVALVVGGVFLLVYGQRRRASSPAHDAGANYFSGWFDNLR